MAVTVNIPLENPETNKPWKNGDEWLTAGRTFTYGPNGWTEKDYNSKSSSASKGSTSSKGSGQPATQEEIDQQLRDAANSVASSKTGLPEGVGRSDAYDLTTQPAYILTNMDPKTRDPLLKELYLRGAYGNQKIGNGASDSDINAFQAYLRFSNYKEVHWENALGIFKRQFPINPSLQAGGGTSKPPKQVTNPDDLKAVFKKASQDLLGRAVDDNIAEQFVKSFQNQQVQQQTQMDSKSGGVVVQAPDAGVAAKKVIEQKYGQEVRVQKATNFGNIMDQMIKGLAR